jgi:CMP-2-keto-3-deoxyoctulosonic acid synthetase
LKTPNFSTLRSSNYTAPPPKAILRRAGSEDGEFQIPNVVYKHIGIYGFTRSFLQQFVAMPKSPLEEAESLEQLRVLENGYRIRVLATDYNGFGIDTEADLLRAEERLSMKS